MAWIDNLGLDEFELETVTTDAGDVWALGLVNRRGGVERVVDVDTGADVTLPPGERARVEELVRVRRESEVR